MKTWIFLLSFLLISGNAFAQLAEKEKASDYWVYVRLEDRSGVTEQKDRGRSKRGDIIDVVPATKNNAPTPKERQEYLIYKTSITSSKKAELLEGWIDTPDFEHIAYRRKAVDLNKLGVPLKKGVAAEKVPSENIVPIEKTSRDLARYRIKQKFYAYVQRPLIKLANIATKRAFAADNISTINTSGEDYNTIALWEDATDNDLVTEMTTEIAHVYDDQGDLGRFNLTGATTNASYYRKVTVPSGERHNGDATQGATVSHTFSGAGACAEIWEDYGVIDGLNVQCNSDGNNYTWALYASRADNIVFSRNLVNYYGNSFYTTSYAIVVEIKEGAYDHYILNNIVVEAEGNKGIRTEWISGTSANVYVYGNTVHSSETQAFGSDSNANLTVYYKNNIGIAPSAYNAFYFNDNDVHDYNCSDDTSATGTNSLNTCSLSDFTSSTSGSEDFTLTEDAPAIDAGVDLGTTYGEAEIDVLYRNRDTEGDTWDMGAHEYVSATTPTRNRFMIIQ